jgi:4-hydroxyacetophenone monooxygenase
MALHRAVAPISEDDAAIERALKDAHLPSLLPALAHITGDISLLKPELTPDTSTFAGDQGGLSPDKQEEVRALARDVLIAFRDGGNTTAPPPSVDAVREMMNFMTGGAISDDYLPLLLEELAFPKEDARAPQWRKEELSPDTPFTVGIIGSGMSGILAAIRLKQAGVPYVVFEKNEDVGGTWFENTYPGARVDSSNHVYSYSFAQRIDWPYHFSTQGVLLDYFRGCADEYGIRGSVRFGTEVVSADWDEDRAAWQLKLRTADGKVDSTEVQALISAVGQLNRPKIPDIPGMDRFKGPLFHSAQWDHSVDLKGKRVAVIGTGASASQFIPVVAEQAGHLTIFQRTPNWYLPVPNYHEPVPDGLQWLFRHVPHYAQWYRFWLFWTVSDGLLAMAKVDPEWQPRDRSVSAGNDQLRAMLTEYLEMSLQDRPDLVPKVIPPYPPASKRIVLDNGIWPATLKRENVRLATEEIREVTPEGITTCDGEELPMDVIILGTGFQASRFLTPMKVRGRGGVDLHEQWDGDARAYLGIVVPGFPNFFLLYGPNTNIVVNGSIVYFSECEVQYVMGCLRLLLERGCRAMDCKPEAHDAYNVRIDEGNLQMAWGVSTVNSWYKNEKGRVTQNWPFTLREYWQQTREPNPEDYIVA